MPWVKIDDQFTLHPKLLEAGTAGIALQVGALCYCSRNLTDGFVRASALPSLTPCLNGELAGAVEALIAAGIWHVVEGGYQVHDYGEYQMSKADVEALRAQRAEAGKRGVEARRDRRAKQVGKQTESKSVRKPSTNTPANDKQIPIPIPIPKPEALTTDVVEVVPKDQEIALTGPRSAETKAVSARDITAAYVDAFRETHDGADPIDPKGMAGLVSKALKARTPPEAVMRAAVECGRTGAGARGFQRVLFEKPRGRPEPKGFQGIRDYVESLKEGP